MTQPLALVFYEKLLPGSQLVNRLQDLGYRVLTVPDAAGLPACAEQEKPLVVLADLTPETKVLEAVSQMRGNATTSHVPIIGFADEKDEAKQKQALAAGANVVVGETAILTHLEQFLERALRID